jgi:hypothetical protein
MWMDVASPELSTTPVNVYGVGNEGIKLFCDGTLHAPPCYTQVILSLHRHTHITHLFDGWKEGVAFHNCSPRPAVGLNGIEPAFVC